MLANMGLPLLPLHWAFAFVWLVPVALLEASVYRRRTARGAGRAVGASGVANLVSTVVGVPLAWVVAAIVLAIVNSTTSVMPRSPEALGFFHAVWLPPVDEDEFAFYRVYPIAVAAVLPFCLPFSVLVERPIVRRILKAERRVAHDAVWRANLLSYAVLAAFCLGWIGYTQAASPALPYEDALAVEAALDVATGNGAGSPDAERKFHLSNRAWFGPPRYALSVYGATGADEQARLTEVAQTWLDAHGAGPLLLEFHTEPRWEEYAEGHFRFEADLLAEHRLDGRRSK